MIGNIAHSGVIHHGIYFPILLMNFKTITSAKGPLSPFPHFYPPFIKHIKQYE